MDKFSFNGSIFSTFYFDTILVEVTAGGGSTISICNYTVKLPQTAAAGRGGGGGGVRSSPDVCRQTSPPLQLTVKGWNDLKRLFNCIESYYRICLVCSPTIQSLITRYRNYFVKPYRNAILQTGSPANSATNNSLLEIPSGSYQHINVDLPLVLRELDERRLPTAQHEEEDEQQQTLA